MLSDRPETTPKSLDLEVSPTCLREKDRELLEVWCGLVGAKKGTLLYKSILAEPHYSAQERTVRDPWSGLSASEKFDLTADWNCLW